MNTFDLQIQSTASDGKHAPADIVRMAKDLGISPIAITDHDTVAGVADAMHQGQELGVRVISGIEMSVEEHGAHILGCGIDPAHAGLLAELEKFKEGRINGAKQMVENLKRAGFSIEWEDVTKQAGGVIARPHLARAVLARPENREKLGGISTTHDFIEAYLKDDSPLYVKRSHISACDAIALIRSAGGVAIWSHPAIHFEVGYEGLEDFLRSLIEWGIDGAEVFNASHTEDDAEYIQTLVLKYRLLRTAGSDFHEAGDHESDERGLHSARTLGDYPTYGFALDDIIPQLDEAMTKRRRETIIQKTPD